MSKCEDCIYRQKDICTVTDEELKVGNDPNKCWNYAASICPCCNCGSEHLDMCGNCCTFYGE